MGSQIIRQPDGRLCVFSSVVDGLTLVDATEDEVREYFIEIAVETARREADRALARTRERGSSAVGPFAMTYEQAVRMDTITQWRSEHAFARCQLSDERQVHDNHLWTVDEGYTFYCDGDYDL